MPAFPTMRAQLQAAVEPHTRYTLDSLAIRDGTESVARGRITVSEQAQFSVRTSTGAGALPAGIPTRPSEAAVNASAQEHAQALKAAVTARLTRWAAGQPLDASLSTSDCWDGATAFGTTRTCSGCNGAKQLTCNGCGGRGQTRCTACDGGGSARCSSCSGGRVACSSCGGQRGRNVQTGSDGSFRWEQCYACSGSGQQNCGQCRGSGRRTCMMCSFGNVRCARCGGSGRIDCSSCSATGATHMIARTECSVTHQLVFSHALSDQQVATEFGALSTRAMMALCDVTPREPSVQGTQVVRSYDLTLPVAELFVTVAGEELRLLGLGPDAAIRDYRNVVGRLLEHDVHALRAARAGHPWFVLAPSVALERALEVVLDSEANQAILDAKHGGRGPAERTPAAIAAASQGSVSAGYVQALDLEFTASLRRAVLGPLGIPMVSAAAGASVLAFGLAHVVARVIGFHPAFGPTQMGILCILAATGGAEWWARQRLASQFDGPSWTRMTPLIGKLGIGWMLRGAAVGAGLSAWAGLWQLFGAPR